MEESMKDPKQKGKTLVADDAVHDDKAIEELADVVIESLREQYRSDLEPFELYAQKVRFKIHININEFRTGFFKGYHVLLEELHKEHVKSKAQREEPHGRIKP